MRWQRVGAVLLILLVLFGGVLIGQVYARYWRAVHRLPEAVEQVVQAHGGREVRLTQISPWLPKALIATEDRTFYTNLGVSTRGIIRSLWVDWTTGRVAEGGSTLTQQLVRDRMLTFDKTVRRKVTEALLAVLVTLLYSKQQILTMYLNQVYLGDGAYGVDAASWRYFGEPPAKLTLAQAALVAGLPQAPSAYDPLRDLRAAKLRQQEVLFGMVSDHMISRAEAARAFRAPLGLVR